MRYSSFFPVNVFQLFSGQFGVSGSTSGRVLEDNVPPTFFREDDDLRSGFCHHHFGLNFETQTPELVFESST